MAPPTAAESASPIGIANLPNQRHKIVAKRGAGFTIMVAGESGLGKTTFINTLFSTTIKNYADHKRRHQKQVDKTVEIEITKAELEEKFFKVRLTVIDTPGFGDYVNNRDSWMPIIEFLDDQHESYMLQEQQPRRQDKIDLRVHACLYFIRPTGHTLKPLDIEVMKRLCSRVNLIPVIAKADTLSPSDLARFKQRIQAVIEAQNIKIYQPPIEEDDEAAAQHARSLMAAMPFAVIGSEKDVKTGDGRIVKGRQYSWGVAEVENEDHCDFKKLRSILIRTHMLDLIHTTEELHYEAYRAQQMETRKFGEARPRKLDNPKFKERRRRCASASPSRSRSRSSASAVEQKLIAERDRLNRTSSRTHAPDQTTRDGARGHAGAPAPFAATAAVKRPVSGLVPRDRTPLPRRSAVPVFVVWSGQRPKSSMLLQRAHGSAYLFARLRLQRSEKFFSVPVGREGFRGVARERVCVCCMYEVLRMLLSPSPPPK
ncbi:cell division control protein [Verticillium alfalfae VaMs.102]|uniref:Cell division control protein n=1 Tax=Verticillium alfalfae (strain VaMs.102 / ATCC MYA-4576 / FGSC 10136) TaxID=526221 RepID=C9SGI6_VERA1|nr:cell division control protein [Verticillium alfalfae VaMs.102]EEY18136.1 cell division control protein [Verticillium alfalfae VaMs.102]